MESDRQRRIEDLFHAALELPDGERRRLLDEACGQDGELRREVESLLEAAAGQGSFLAVSSRPPRALPFTLDPGHGEWVPPARIGPYRLLREIGRGGMGRVYLAEQETETFRRTVAIKLLAWTGPFESRFRTEQRILAALEHPGIARLYDGGTTPDGLPFLVLEYVEGENLVVHCRERRLPIRERLDLFRRVCAAVQYAHQHLVVHRDLKPANILVTSSGEPKLLDFGIAKLLQPDAEGGAGETIAGLRLMTPSYASPEQVRGEPVSTASDVYSLGVILFELLTAERPYRLTTGSLEEMARALAHQSIRRPSVVAASSAGAAPFDPGRLRGDLDTIVLKALDPDPARRYSSASELAEDLRRHVEGLPVLARPDRVIYRTRKFVRRHLVGVAAAAMVLVSLVTGLAGALWQAQVASAERDRARAQAARADATAAFLTELFASADPARTRGEKLTLREVLDRGAGRIDRDLAGQHELQASMLTLIGSVYRDLGLFEPARAALQRALAAAREGSGDRAQAAAAHALTELAAVERLAGDPGAGRRMGEEALAIRERILGPDHADVARTLSVLATIDRLEGKSAAGRDRLERALAIAARHGIASAEAVRWLNNRGLMHLDLGALEPALADFRRAVDEVERLEGPDSPLLALPLDNLGMTLRAVGRHQEAVPLLERALVLVENGWGTSHMQYGTALNSLGMTLSEMKRYEEAIARFRSARDVYEKALGSDHAALGWPLTNEGVALLEMGRPAEALAVFRRALAVRERAFGAEHWQVASSHSDVGLALTALGQHAAAEKALRLGVDIARRVIVPPTTTLAEQMTYLAKLLAETGRRAEARALYGEALAIFREQFPRGHPSTVACEEALARLGGEAGG